MVYWFRNVPYVLPNTHISALRYPKFPRPSLPRRSSGPLSPFDLKKLLVPVSFFHSHAPPPSAAFYDQKNTQDGRHSEAHAEAERSELFPIPPYEKGMPCNDMCFVLMRLYVQRVSHDSPVHNAIDPLYTVVHRTSWSGKFSAHSAMNCAAACPVWATRGYAKGNGSWAEQMPLIRLNLC